MQSFALTWTGRTGRPHVSVASYDKRSAETRKGRLEAEKAKNVRIVEIKPGEVLRPQA